MKLANDIKRRLVSLVLVIVAPVLALTIGAGLAKAQVPVCGLQGACSIEDLGNDQFKITYVLTNVSPHADVMFKWRLESPGIAPEWTSVAFEAPPGWSGDHDTSQLDFATPNGSGNLDRLYSASAAGACGGPNQLTFAWTFDRNGGPLPNCGLMTSDDFKVHVQRIDLVSCDNVGGSFLCPYVVPTEAGSWGSLKAIYR